jgi:hypothetical protein
MNKKTLKPKFTLDALLKRNQQYIKQYQKNSLMRLIASSQLAKKSARTRLLDCIQVFSNYFQKTVMLRHILCENKKFLAVTQVHLDEEFNHNVSLMRDRKNRPPVWDAILDATAAWFTWKILTLDEDEKTVLVHLVLEASANVFFHKAHKIMQQYGETDYFKIHSELDEEHEHMGKELLTSLSPEKYQRLFEIQQQGWDVLNAVCDRIAQLTAKNFK